MDPQTPNLPSFELPSPMSEQSVAGVPERQPINAESTQEQVSQHPSVGNQATMPVPASAQPAASGPAQVNQPTAANLSFATPAIADDNDLIEKAWVDKAKEIVAKTKNDPYVQNNELSKFKADYIKKRYNKEVKLSEN